MNKNESPYLRDLVLAGGGHAHVEVLRRLGMTPVPGLRVTLVCPDMHTPYSGMLPGLIAGHYKADEMHIDLRRLARFAGAQIVPATVTGLDVERQHVEIGDRPALRYDLLSLNTGSTPAWDSVPGAAEHVIPVKPVSTLTARLAAFERRWADAGIAPRVAVVGAGAGGVELVLALAHRLRGTAHAPRLSLLTRSETVLAAHNKAVQHRFRRILAERAIDVHTGQAVVGVDHDELTLADGTRHATDTVFWATSASAPEWLAGSGLTLDERGFLCVGDTLQSISHPNVFAAGDVAALPEPRPKSGVFAVREGPILADNLRRQARGHTLRRFKAQKKALALIGTGDRQAVASRDGITLAGKTPWRIKEWIDRRFMARYSDLPPTAPDRDWVDRGTRGLPEQSEPPPMRRGAKVGQTVLDRVLDRLARSCGISIDAAIEHRADAALFTSPAGQRLAQSFDYLPDFIGDPYRLGEIAAQHALNNLYAVGAAPHSALVHASVPLAVDALMEEQLFQMLAGASAVLAEAGATLLGGHSSEAAGLGIGFAVNGVLPPLTDSERAPLAAGMALILTQPLGTGVLFAADRRHLARGEWIAAAIARMRESNAAAAACLHEHEARACTDISGFGLIGHLENLLRSSPVDGVVYLDALPLLDGAALLAADGMCSSPYDQNRAMRRQADEDPDAETHKAWPLLFDPQIAGGLLGALPAHQAERCVDALRQAGYLQAAIIGHLADRAECPPAADSAQTATHVRVTAIKPAEKQALPGR
ncbi:selenide, water dikinase SelD [Salinisphaera aquimarina]|uniref:Selenide, water dikinase SelD n=1 Tax=Salinisphaera aquimarina TaxID=2094031 RepID=A0ABV7EME4_9GAMM